MDFHELPHDMIKAVVRKLDIDTRRSLGIYTRLQVPVQLRKKLEGWVQGRLRRCKVFKFESGSYMIVLRRELSYCWYDIEDDGYVEYDIQSGDVTSVY